MLHSRWEPVIWRPLPRIIWYVEFILTITIMIIAIIIIMVITIILIIVAIVMMVIIRNNNNLNNVIIILGNCHLSLDLDFIRGGLRRCLKQF